MEEIPFGEDRLTLSPGDTLFLYTDGVSEAKNEQGELYGEKRLVEVLERLHSRSSEELVNDTASEIWRYQGEAEQADDVTIVALRYRAGRPRTDPSATWLPVNVNAPLPLPVFSTPTCSPPDGQGNAGRGHGSVYVQGGRGSSPDSRRAPALRKLPQS